MLQAYIIRYPHLLGGGWSLVANLSGSYCREETRHTGYNHQPI